MIALLVIVAAGVLVWWLAQRSIRDRKPTRPPPLRCRAPPAGSPDAERGRRASPAAEPPRRAGVDVETTGLGERAEVLAVAVIDTTGRVLLDTVSLPQGPIPRGASDVNGLTRAKRRSMGARPWPAVHAELWPLLFGARVALAWNAEFDRRLLVANRRAPRTDPAAVGGLALRHEGGSHDPRRPV